MCYRFVKVYSSSVLGPLGGTVDSGLVDAGCRAWDLRFEV